MHACRHTASVSRTSLLSFSLLLILHACRVPLYHAGDQQQLNTSYHLTCICGLTITDNGRLFVTGKQLQASEGVHCYSITLACNELATATLPRIYMQGFTRPTGARPQPAGLHSQPAEPARRALVAAERVASSVYTGILSCMQQRDSTAPAASAAYGDRQQHGRPCHFQGVSHGCGYQIVTNLG